MFENDPRYRAQDFLEENHLPGGAAPGRHDLARAGHLAQRRDLRIAGLLTGRRR